LGEGPPGDDNPATRALIGLSATAIPDLLAVLQKEPPPDSEDGLSTEQWARLRAAHVLSQLHYSQIVPLLLREIGRDPHPIARMIYAIYLTRHDVPKAVEALVGELKKGERTVPDVVITLKNIHNPAALPLLRPLLDDPRPEVRFGAAEVMVSLGDREAVPILLDEIGKPDELRAALVLPEAYRDAILPVLRKHRATADPPARLQIAMKLADLGDAEGFDDLLDALHKEGDSYQRGGEGPLSEGGGIGKRVIAMVGRPDTYDPLGSLALRDAVIDRWRRRWKTEGVCFLEGLKKRVPLEGQQDAKLGTIHLTRDMQDMRNFFVLAGRQMYEIGAMDGSFPPLGRQLGDQSGIWAHPVKVLDGFSFTVGEEGQSDWPLADCRHFSHRFSSGDFHYERESLRAMRRDFVDEETPAIFSQVKFQNKMDRPRTLTLRFEARVNLRPSWASGLPNDLDRITYEDGRIYAEDPALKEGRVLLGADRHPKDHQIADNVVTLSYPIQLPAHGETTLTFLVQARPNEGKAQRQQEFTRLISRADAVLTQKEVAYQKAVFGGVRFSCDNKKVEDAFYLAKANLLLLIADLRPHFPAPYFFAGLPVYPQLFSNDTAYSIPGATAAGFTEAAHGTLVSLADQARQQEGGVPHEVATNGRMIGRGNAQEIPQWIGACWRYFQWTNDREFLKRVYPQCRQSLAFALKQFDPNGGGYLEGPGLIETSGMGPRKLDAACYLFDAYRSLEGMAEVLNEPEVTKEYESRAAAFKARFNKDWWIPEQGMWADSLTAEGKQRLDGYWSVLFPQQVGIADPDKAEKALDRIEKGWVNHWGGVHTRQPDISGQGSGVVTSNLFATTAFRNGRSDFGWSMVELAARAPLEERMLGAFVEMIPPGESDFIQLWSVGPFLEAIIEGLAGIHPQAASDRVEVSLNMPRSLHHYTLKGLRVGVHTFSLFHRRQNNQEQITLTHDQGDRPLVVTFDLPPRRSSEVVLKGKSGERKHPNQDPQGSSARRIEVVVPPGASLSITSR
jgi:hypothetical protein